MYLQTSRLQYNLQCVGVFQKAHSDKNIQAEACRYIIPQKCEQFKQKAYIRTPKSGLDNRISRPPSLNCVGSNYNTIKKNSPTCHGDRCLDKPEKLWYNHAPNIMTKLSHFSICQKHIIHTTKYYLKKVHALWRKPLHSEHTKQLSNSIDRIPILLCPKCSDFLFFSQTVRKQRSRYLSLEGIFLSTAKSVSYMSIRR